MECCVIHNFGMMIYEAGIKGKDKYLHPTAYVGCTVYPKKYAHGFVVLCFVVVMQSFIMNSHEVFIHIHQGCFAGTWAIVRLPQCQWSKPDGYGNISQCVTTTKHSKAKTVCIFLGIYCNYLSPPLMPASGTEVLIWIIHEVCSCATHTNVGHFSKRCHLTNIAIPFVNITWSHNCYVFVMRIPYLNTWRPRQMAAIFQTTFSMHFLEWKC